MLVLTRREQESVIIKVGDVLVRMTVIDIKGERCRLGFVAPQEVVINRQEVHALLHPDAELP